MSIYTFFFFFYRDHPDNKDKSVLISRITLSIQNVSCLLIGWCVFSTGIFTHVHC